MTSRPNFCLILNGRKRCGWWFCWTGEGRKGEKPRHTAVGPVPSPEGRRRTGTGSAPLRSVPGAALPPLPRPPHRRAPPAPLASLRTKPAAKGRRGQLPGSSLGHPLSPVIAAASRAEIPSAGSPAGIKAPSGACSNRTGSDVRCPRLRRHLRPLSCPWFGYYWGLFQLGKAKAETKRRVFSVPSELRALERLALGEGYLSLCLSFINVSDSSLPLSLCAFWSWLAHGRPCSFLAQTRAQRCTKDTRKPRIRFQIKLPIHKLTR